MRFATILTLAFAMAASIVALPTAQADEVLSPNGQTVHDTSLHVTWLANANLAGSPDGQFGVANISPSGAMDYPTAQQWVGALNARNYLGHNTWSLPDTPRDDPTCSTAGPQQNRFGIGCKNSALGSLYANGLGLQYPNTAVPIPATAVGPFSNVQPYLYWTRTSQSPQGSSAFSFMTGFQGSNVDDHAMYVLPMFQGPPPGSGFSPCPCPLQPSPDGTLVYDPTANVTWLADANAAADAAIPCDACAISTDGSMSHTSAMHLVDAMNSYSGGTGWLGVTTWTLPPAAANDPACSFGQHTRSTFGFNCTGGPLGELFYNQLGLSAGTPAVDVPATTVGPFSNLQPYLYWSCQQGPASPTDCSGAPADNFQWSFSFGNGFEGTDFISNQLFVTVYYPDPPGSPAVVPSPRVPSVPTACRDTSGTPKRCA